MVKKTKLFVLPKFGNPRDSTSACLKMSLNLYLFEDKFKFVSSHDVYHIMISRQRFMFLLHFVVYR